MEHAPLEADALGKRGFERAIDRFLREHRSRQRHRRDRFRRLHRFVHQVRRRHHAGDEARALGFLRVHHAAGEAEVHRLGLADGACEALRSADARNDAELDFGLAEFRIVRRNDQIALHRKLASAAKRETGNRRDHRLSRVRGAVPVGGEVPEKRIHEGFIRHLLDVGAGREGLLRSGDDETADIAIRLESVDGGG